MPDGSVRPPGAEPPTAPVPPPWRGSSLNDLACPTRGERSSGIVYQCSLGAKPPDPRPAGLRPPDPPSGDGHRETLAGGQTRALAKRLGLSFLASRLSPLASRLSPLASRLSPLASRLFCPSICLHVTSLGPGSNPLPTSPTPLQTFALPTPISLTQAKFPPQRPPQTSALKPTQAHAVPQPQPQPPVSGLSLSLVLAPPLVAGRSPGAPGAVWQVGVTEMGDGGVVIHRVGGCPHVDLGVLRGWARGSMVGTWPGIGRALDRGARKWMARARWRWWGMAGCLMRC
jgi:hypothetical protein